MGNDGEGKRKTEPYFREKNLYQSRGKIGHPTLNCSETFQLPSKVSLFNGNSAQNNIKDLIF